MTSQVPLQHPYRRALVLALVVLVLLATFLLIREGNKKDNKIGVGLTGVHHLGRSYNISEFVVDGYSGMNVGREGGGGREVCCVLIPKKWRPGLTVEVKWSINDWSHENREEMKAGNYRTLAFGGAYRAIVPLETYREPGRVYVHFFPHGRVRVVSSNVGPGGDLHPIADNDPRAADTATVGTPVGPEAFEDQALDAELRERARKGGMQE